MALVDDRVISDHLLAQCPAFLEIRSGHRPGDKHFLPVSMFLRRYLLRRGGSSSRSECQSPSCLNYSPDSSISPSFCSLFVPALFLFATTTLFTLRLIAVKAAADAIDRYLSREYRFVLFVPVENENRNRKRPIARRCEETNRTADEQLLAKSPSIRLLVHHRETLHSYFLAVPCVILSEKLKSYIFTFA